MISVLVAIMVGIAVLAPTAWAWQVPGPPYVASESDGVFRLEVPPETAAAFPRFAEGVFCRPGQLLSLEAEARGENVRGGYGVYLSISFFDEAGKRLSFNQSGPAGGEGWEGLHVAGIAPAGTREATFNLLLNGHGVGYFRAVRTTLKDAPAVEAPGEPVRLIVSSRPVCDALVGIGFEDDGWSYDSVNAEQGVTEEDLRLREARIREMDPDWVRMFFWYREWNPSGDGRTFTWDSDGMRSHYRSLSLYEELGATVNITGVEWGIENPFADVEAMARAWTALARHLIEEKGFTCVRQWTLTNEPNTSFLPRGGTFEAYVHLHEAVVGAFRAAGLPLQIVGSDDTNGGLPWIRRCVETPAYDQLVDVYASHRYLKKQDRPLAAPFFQDRLDLLAGRKPFVVAEFGFHDARTEGPLHNPVMEDYDYAVWTADFALDGLNRGVAGFAIWCAHEVYYPFGSKMNYGLWNYRDRGWSPRPVYYFWCLLTRHTDSGDAVYAVASSHPTRFRAVRIADHVFFVNASEHALSLRWENGTPEGGVVLTEETLPGGRPSDLLGIPPRAFGHARWSGR